MVQKHEQKYLNTPMLSIAIYFATNLLLTGFCLNRLFWN